MKIWIIVGSIAVLIIGLWVWNEGERITGGPGDNMSTTTDPVLGAAKPANGDVTEHDGTTMVQIALIALEDNGASGKKIGCNDSVVLVDREIPAATAPLRAALLQLLSLPSSSFGASGLHTSLAGKDIELTNVSIENGEATIELEGTLALGGVCEAPRIQAQLVETALQFPTVNVVTVFLNGEPLEEALSEM